MTLATRWIHKIDGTDLNDAISSSHRSPRPRPTSGATTLLTTDMQARTPVFNRQQPAAGRFTFLITNVPDPTPSTWPTSRPCAPSSRPAFTRTPGPGEADTGQSVAVYFDAGLVVDTETGLCTAKAIAPDPTWS